MSTCFVIQPFDGGKFDKRYDDVFVPAIEAAHLTPYRVDRDPSVTIPIDQIEAEIRRADICLADISTDNPNVWFELGFAIAAGKEVVMVCELKTEPKFPFDIQHRAIIQYKTESTSDFNDVCTQITTRLKALLSKEEKLDKISSLSSVAEIEGLASHEMVVLTVIAENIEGPNHTVLWDVIRRDMENVGYTKIATTLGLNSLLKKEMIVYDTLTNFNGDPYSVYSITQDGLLWLEQNQHRLILKKEEPPF